MADREQYCTFHLGKLFLGVRVQDVQEVIRYQDLTRVPLAPPTVRGLINLRGQIVTAIDLRKRFGLADREPDALPMNVVVRTDDGPVSLLVDEIGDVLDVSSDLWEAPPETLSESARALVRGVYKLEGRLMLELDGVRALETSATS
ncbi:MAG: chemotaxis protein CheW [Planctomycetota bacterium]